MLDRLDVYLVKGNFVPSRERAKKLVKSRKVMIGGVVCTKPSTIVKTDDVVEVKADEKSYVGRGAYKLLHALEYFNIALDNAVCADIGASTGGFTEVMLEKGARLVYAIDVGHNQLADKLKDDPRVKNLEGLNVRYIKSDIIDEKIDFFSVDVSFISLKLILENLLQFFHDSTNCVFLLKPQFEVGKKGIGKNGIVKSNIAHRNLLQEIVEYMFKIGYNVINITYSPLKGGDGNIEYLIYANKMGYEVENRLFNYSKIVTDAFDSFKEK